MVHPIQLGQNQRMSFSRIKEVVDMPNLIEVQKNSFQWFLDEGLREVFKDVSPIEDHQGDLVMEFIDYSLSDEPKYSVEECKERDATYAAPLKVKVRLIKKTTGEINEQDVYMGEFPLMTDTGTFIINGAERVIVSQLVRSPGIYYACEMDKSGTPLYSSTVIPNRGAWLEYETDSNDVMYIRIDRTRKLPLTVFLRALGYGTDAQILDLLGEDKRLLATLQKDSTTTQEEGLIEIYKRLRPGEPANVDSVSSLLYNMFFDAKRYDLARVGRYKFNKKMAIAARLANRIAAEDIISAYTGEILVAKDETISLEKAEEIQQNGVNVAYVYSNTPEKDVVKVIGNGTVDIADFLPDDFDYDLKKLGITEKVCFEPLKEILEQGLDNEALAKALQESADILVPKHIIIDDIVASISYILNLNYNIGTIDDIDHLGNRRLRSVGELLQNQFRIGFTRMERSIRERMSTQESDIVTPQALINIRPVSAAIKEFFGSSQLSQFMDQTNPLGELTHKRRLSALGPGGLSRERASFQVRDVHDSHYGRMCPIETPEGPNIGLIGSLSTYATVDEYGFIKAPYRRVQKDKKGNVCVTNTIDYLTADVEDLYTIAQANEPLDDDGKFLNKKVAARKKERVIEADPNLIDYMDVSPKQVVSVATAMIPFLENDDANRALMGANMQRQAVPLIKPQSPIVGTGIEYKAAIDSGICILAKKPGVVEDVDGQTITVRNDDKTVSTYKLQKYIRSNQGTCINQKTIVKIGQRVEQGQVLADGPSSDNGELALGRNVLIAYMTWEGYNYEDAILINENLVKEDMFTSIHVEEYESEARDTKLGPEEITREIPNLPEESLKDLDERGIIRIGAEVRAGDILVGKVTPKGETELTPEERLLRAIFGEKARDVRDTSLRVPHGEAGIVVDVKEFTRANKDELSPGVNQLIRVYIAQKRKISVGDKMAGRHGNKGVISRILPQEDMPFLPDGTPLQIVLNPLGVPSRMNIGQVLEVHLGYAAKALGWKIATPVFDGAKESDILETLEKAGMQPDAKTQLYDGRTGEPFDNRVTVGYIYFLKLHHLVDDKIHARSTGPYSLVTQQPLGGKAQFGGQRFGEMEVWALEAYGAAYTLQEILTVKSDDVVGRVKTYAAIVKGENVSEPGIPESFKVLLKELQSLALDVKVCDEVGNEVSLKDADEDIKSVVNMSGNEKDVVDADYLDMMASSSASSSTAKMSEGEIPDYMGLDEESEGIFEDSLDDDFDDEDIVDNQDISDDAEEDTF